MGFREQALAGMERLQILDLLLHGRRLRPRQELVVLNYHRIVDGPLLLDPGVVSATREGFAEQVLQVARFATPVSIAQVCAAHGVPFLSVKDISNNEYHAASDLDGFTDFPVAEIGKRAGAFACAVIKRI